MVSREIEIDLRVYPIAAVHKVALALSDRCTAAISQPSEHRLVVTLTARDDRLVDELPHIFLTTLTDQTVQEAVNLETHDIRVALVRAALLEALGPPPSKEGAKQ